jgi:hypothetical protein
VRTNNHEETALRMQRSKRSWWVENNATDAQCQFSPQVLTDNLAALASSKASQQAKAEITRQSVGPDRQLVTGLRWHNKARKCSIVPPPSACAASLTWQTPFPTSLAEFPSVVFLPELFGRRKRTP